MRLFELKIDREGITVWYKGKEQKDSEHRLTGTQKFYIIIALIALAALIAGLHFIGWKALLGALGALLMLGFYKLITSV